MSRPPLLTNLAEGLPISLQVVRDNVYQLCRGTQNLSLRMQTNLIRIAR